MTIEKNIRLTQEIAEQIENPGESIFAKAVSKKPHLEVTYQVPVGDKLIDFEVKNTKANSSGKLVEVTSTPSDKIKHRQKKSGQRHAMQDSGEPFTILGGEFLSNIDANNR